MTTTPGNHDDHGTDHEPENRIAVLRRARPVMLLRARAGTAGESARVVHLAPPPTEETGAVSALCGALLRPEDHEPVTPGQGMPCDTCLISSQDVGSDPDPPETTPAGASAPDPTSPGLPPGAPRWATRRGDGRSPCTATRSDSTWAVR
jgi:hypothetical protein